jgi:hypothetical protein
LDIPASGPHASSDPSSARRLGVRFVDVHSGRSAVLGGVDAVGALLRCVERCLEGGRAGTRFPLLRLVGRATPLSVPECEALVREVARLRGHLSVLAASNLLEETGPASGDDRQTPADGPPRGTFSPPGAKSLADVFALPLAALEHHGRLGAISGRGARFETCELEEPAAAPGAVSVVRAIAG